MFYTSPNFNKFLLLPEVFCFLRDSGFISGFSAAASHLDSRSKIDEALACAGGFFFSVAFLIVL